METRRQLKLARAIRDSVSRAISTKLSDPRITGLVSVTGVTISPDAKNATVSLSVFGADETASKLTFTAIRHAAGHLQAILGKDLPGRVCPHLSFELDTTMKKTLETLRLIDEAEQEYQASDEEETESDEDDTEA